MSNATDGDTESMKIKLECSCGGWIQSEKKDGHVTCDCGQSYAVPTYLRSSREQSIREFTMTDQYVSFHNKHIAPTLLEQKTSPPASTLHGN